MKILTLVIAMTSAASLQALADDRGAIPIVPRGSIAQVDGYMIDFGEVDDAQQPRSWQGPMVISRGSGLRCTVSDDVAIIERPLALLRGHLVYVSTFSGSERKLYVIDARDCAVKWSSRHYSGPARIASHTLSFPGERFEIGADGLPT